MHIPHPNIHEFASQLISVCPMCRGKNPVGLVEVIEDTGSTSLLRITCRFCETAMLVKVHMMPNGVFGNTLITDLNAAEAGRLRTENPVTIDHVLGVHSLSNDAWRTFINS